MGDKHRDKLRNLFQNPVVRTYLCKQEIQEIRQLEEKFRLQLVEIFLLRDLFNFFVLKKNSVITLWISNNQRYRVYRVLDLYPNADYQILNDEPSNGKIFMKIARTDYVDGRS